MWWNDLAAETTATSTLTAEALRGSAPSPSTAGRRASAATDTRDSTAWPNNLNLLPYVIMYLTL